MKIDGVTKVLLSGSFSTGKTSTLSLLHEALEHRGVPSVVRLEPARHCPLSLDLHQDVDTARWLMGDLIREESELVSRPGLRVVLCDGGPPDILVHTPGHPDPEATLLGLARSWQPTYDFVFWARPDIAQPIAADDVRVVDEGYRQRIDTALPAAFDTLSVTSHQLPHRGTDRVAVILKQLGVMP
ncbi:hypothetical protein H4696_009841 [Amycolatopsis lexingtonensis]|uniref:NadR/Ttd14 AAA domain-containing protein n=1 Tax=Amycolatopsis lexingtonensis TaxID=218822 RepID=A0ABR9IHU9_9PSEU|nr:ATP-binding protein [Amycolatopsis lexingtonensis]MBE1502741.1 hypothetical protein [Amycolatopsis lexingtonensis]